MQQASTLAPGMARERAGGYGQLLLSATKWYAIGGGALFTALVVMSIISIVGRKLWNAPVPGDVEVLQMCSAIAASAFFPYCHMVRGDVKVDFFTAHLSPRLRAWLDTAGSLLVGLFGLLIAWRTGVGAASLREAGETSAILGWPVWLAQALLVPGFLLLALSGFHTAAHHWAGRGDRP